MGQFLDFIGEYSGYEGDIEIIGHPSSPPTRETLVAEKNPRSLTCFENISNISKKQSIEVFTTQYESDFLLQSQIVYCCFVDCVTWENLTSLLMSGLNQI